MSNEKVYRKQCKEKEKKNHTPPLKHKYKYIQKQSYRIKHWYGCYVNTNNKTMHSVIENNFFFIIIFKFSLF